MILRDLRRSDRPDMVNVLRISIGSGSDMEKFYNLMSASNSAGAQ